MNESIIRIFDSNTCRAVTLEPASLTFSSATGPSGPTGNQIYTTLAQFSSSLINGNLDVSGNVSFTNSPTIVNALAANDNSNKVATTAFVQNIFPALYPTFLQAGKEIQASSPKSITFAAGFTTPPIVLVTALNAGYATVSTSSPGPTGPTTAGFVCLMSSGCTGFNWVAFEQ